MSRPTVSGSRASTGTGACSSTRRVMAASRSLPTCRAGSSAVWEHGKDERLGLRRSFVTCKICAMRRLVALAIVATLATFAACARPPKPLPTPAASLPQFPQFPEFVVPAVPPGLSDSPAAGNQVRGWRFLQAGDFKSAERELGAALKADPAFYPAEAAFGWVELARKDAKSALPHFDRALEREHRDVSALVGRGQALVALNRESDALTAFEAAVAIDPSLTDLGRRVDVLRFRQQQEDLTRAREAARAG